MSINTNDYAIVVGISRYPNLGRNLQGPEADAAAVVEWLTDPSGGGLPHDNVFKTSSAVFQQDPRPEDRDLENLLDDLRAKSENQDSGRRLYMYFAGHGFCVNSCDGGVFTAEATDELLRHLYVSSYFEWFYKAALFEEYVLWFDACGEIVSLHSPRPTFFRTKNAIVNSPPLQFVAFAADQNMLAVERNIAGNGVRGVFTYALLEGLKGAARDKQSGFVTSSSLQSYLNDTMIDYMTAQDINTSNISKKPAIGRTDYMEFGVLAAPQVYSIKLMFAQALNGKTANVLDGDLQSLKEDTIQNSIIEIELGEGLYEVEVDGEHFNVPFFKVVDGQRTEFQIA